MNGISHSSCEVKTNVINIAGKLHCQAGKKNLPIHLSFIPPLAKLLRKLESTQKTSASFGKYRPYTYRQAISTYMPSFPIPEEDLSFICSNRKHPVLSNFH